MGSEVKAIKREDKKQKLKAKIKTKEQPPRHLTVPPLHRGELTHHPLSRGEEKLISRCERVRLKDF